MSETSSESINQTDTAKRRLHQILALLWVALGVIVLVESWSLEYMSEYGPGPGLLPFWLGILIIALGCLLLMQLSYRPKELADLSLPSGHAARQMSLIMLCFFGFALLAETVGFLLCIGLLFFFLLVLVERRNWKFSLAVSILSTVGFWIVFVYWLEVQLPLGLLALIHGSGQSW
jgi:putative tricarboxylic transport membrane protein